MARLKPFQPVLVKWEDAQGDEAWFDLEDVDPTLPVITTIGLFVRETDDAIILASCYSRSKRGQVQVNGVSWIPKRMLASAPRALGKPAV